MSTCNVVCFSPLIAFTPTNARFRRFPPFRFLFADWGRMIAAKQMLHLEERREDSPPPPFPHHPHSCDVCEFCVSFCEQGEEEGRKNETLGIQHPERKEL